MIDFPPRSTMAALDEPVIHYWSGYGNLCNTADGRRNDSKSSRRLEQVTCERCRTNLERLGRLPSGESER